MLVHVNHWFLMSPQEGFDRYYQLGYDIEKLNHRRIPYSNPFYWSNSNNTDMAPSHRSLQF